MAGSVAVVVVGGGMDQIHIVFSWVSYCTRLSIHPSGALLL